MGMAAAMALPYLLCLICLFLAAASATCPPRTTGAASCPAGEVRSEETSLCVSKPWSDFQTCKSEAEQGTCIDGNEWVNSHCCRACKETPAPSAGTIMFFLGPVLGICCVCGLMAGCTYMAYRHFSSTQMSAGVIQPTVIGQNAS